MELVLSTFAAATPPPSSDAGDVDISAAPPPHTVDVTSHNNDGDNTACLICFERDRAVRLPCGHASTCVVCTLRLMNLNRPCPLLQCPLCKSDALRVIWGDPWTPVPRATAARGNGSSSTRVSPEEGPKMARVEPSSLAIFDKGPFNHTMTNRAFLNLAAVNRDDPELRDVATAVLAALEPWGRHARGKGPSLATLRAGAALERAFREQTADEERIQHRCGKLWLILVILAFLVCLILVLVVIMDLAGNRMKRFAPMLPVPAPAPPHPQAFNAYGLYG